MRRRASASSWSAPHAKKKSIWSCSCSSWCFVSSRLPFSQPRSHEEREAREEEKHLAFFVFFVMLRVFVVAFFNTEVRDAHQRYFIPNWICLAVVTVDVMRPQVGDTSPAALVNATRPD